MEARNEMSLDKQLEAVWDVIQDRGLLKGVGDDLWDEIKADIGSKLTRPIPTTRTQDPVTRSAEVQAVIIQLQVSLDAPGIILTKIEVQVLLAHIASLEASQPKPQSDDGLREALIAHRDAARMHIHNCAVRYKKEGKAWDGEFVMREMQAAMRMSDAALSRQAPVPKKPPLGKAPEWVKCPICGEGDMRKVQADKDEPGQGSYIYCVNGNCGSNGGTNFDGMSDDDLATKLSAVLDVATGGRLSNTHYDKETMLETVSEYITGMRQASAPVQTSGAVEDVLDADDIAELNALIESVKEARRLLDSCSDDPYDVSDFTDSIIGAKGDIGRLLNLAFKRAAICAQPPAADGRLREALENSRWYVEQFISHTVEKYAGRVLPSNPVKSRVLHDLDVGDSDVLAASLKNEIELAQCLLKEVGAALAQPASGGGE